MLKIDNATNEPETNEMLALFVAVPLLENLEPLDAAVYVFYAYSVARQTAVELFLLLCKLAALWLLERSYAEHVYLANTLKASVADN